MTIDLTPIRARRDSVVRTNYPPATGAQHRTALRESADDVPMLLGELGRATAILAAVAAEHVIEYATDRDEAWGTNPGCSCGATIFPCATGALLA